MTPVVIPTPAGDCFAMYGAAQGPAVLFCPLFGDEALKTSRIWRDLALRLEEHGLATLRFDLPGTGNSAGTPTEPGRVEAWRAAVRACFAWLSERHEGRVVLFGHRFGALLALDAAFGGMPAERLVLLDPPESGTALMRYMRARARLERVGPLPEGPNFIQVGGMPLSDATLTEIADLPTSIVGSPLPPALLVLHDTPTSQSPWPGVLRGHGSDVEVIAFAGHADFVPHDVFRAQAPISVLRQVTNYLKQSARSVAPTAERPSELGSANLRCEGSTEIPVRFGPDQRLFGILCRPDHPASAMPALLLPTTGADPCSGMSRMWTDLARRLALEGMTSLRFDMSGVGESGGNLGAELLSAMYHADRVADLETAVDFLVLQGFDSVTIVGYCAGAYAAWLAAVPNPKISAVLAGNLLYLNFQPKLPSDALDLRPGTSLIGAPNGKVAKIVPAKGIAALRRLDASTRHIVPHRTRIWLRRWATDPKRTRRHMHALVKRGCSVSLVMADNDHGHVRLRRAFGEQLRLPAGVELTVIPNADHLFSDRCHRAQFLDLATAFALRPRNGMTPIRPTSARALETA